MMLKRPVNPIVPHETGRAVCMDPMQPNGPPGHAAPRAAVDRTRVPGPQRRDLGGDR